MSNNADVYDEIYEEIQFNLSNILHCHRQINSNKELNAVLSTVLVVSKKAFDKVWVEYVIQKRLISMRFEGSY